MVKTNGDENNTKNFGIAVSVMPLGVEIDLKKIDSEHFLSFHFWLVGDKLLKYVKRGFVH